MVSLRCKLLVRSELDRLGIRYSLVDLGEVNIIGEFSNEKREQLKQALLQSGLKLMDDENSKIIENIVNVVVEMVHYADEFPKINFSEYISSKLHMDYYKLSHVFSETKGITIEHFIMQHKIEKVKEMLIYDELTVSEIAYRLNYSNTAHLSNQFKKATGLTPSFFKLIKNFRKSQTEDL